MLIDGPSPSTSPALLQLSPDSASSRAEAGSAFQASGVEAIPRGTLAAERLRTVLERLNSGFYDSVEARARIAARAGADLA